MAQDPVALIAQADKAVQSAQSFLNWFGARTYKYERAVELFTRAATALKLQKNYTEAGSIYEKVLLLLASYWLMLTARSS